MKLTKEECMNAASRLYRPYYASVKIQNVYYDINGKDNSIDKDSNLIEQLIKEHFNEDNTARFKDFKLHSYTILKRLNEDELISYIYMLYHNWALCEKAYQNLINYAEKQGVHYENTM